MARRKHIDGICRLCGNHTKLSFEHVPPQSAFNDRPVVQSSIEKLIKKDLDLDKISGKTLQRGAGGYTLCEKCNSLTGGWYGSAYVNWIYQAARFLLLSRGRPSLYYLYRIFPLRVIKQIACMFFSANGERFRDAQQGLVRFALNKENRFLDPHIRIYCFYSPSLRSRQSGVSGVLNFNSHSHKIISEIVFPPMGYVMSFDKIPPDEKLFDITFFSEYEYNDCKELSLKLPSLPIFTYFPGDYRSRDEVLKNRPSR